MSEYCKNCEELLKRATVAEDNFACEVQARLYHQTKWLEYSEECEKYKHALEEIEGIVNKKTEIPICDECAYRNIPECKENCMQDVLGEILDIISKAKGEE